MQKSLLENARAPKMTSLSPLCRWLSHIDFREDGCWVWMGSKNKRGYGKFGLLSRHNPTKRGITIKAHHFLYEIMCGPIQNELDHLCRNPSCVNPRHLEDVTRIENLRRAGMADGFSECQHRNDSKAIYYSQGNLRRRCRICAREHTANYRRRKRYGASHPKGTPDNTL